MSFRPAIIIGISALFVVGLVIGIFVLRYAKTPTTTISTTTRVGEGRENFFRPSVMQQGAPSAAGEREFGAQEIIKKPKTIEFFGTAIRISPFVDEVLEPLLQPIIELHKESGVKPPPSSQAVLSLATSSPALTEIQVFNALYPAFFINALRDVQNQLIAEGAIPANGAMKFDSEEEIKQFMFAAMQYLLSRNIISQDEFESSRRALGEFFDRPYELKREEAEGLFVEEKVFSPAGTEFSFPTKQEALDEFYRTSGVKEGLSPDALRLLPSAPQKRHIAGEKSGGGARRLSATLLHGLMLFERFFSIPSVRAACGPTYCKRPSICFLEGIDVQKGGSDFPIPCCSGRICGAPFGCLELCGNGSRPFIWDPLTNICGCGVGGVAGAGP